jgi:aspartyl-tRNA synthetase
MLFDQIAAITKQQQHQQSSHQIPPTVFTVNCGEIRPKDDGMRVKISGKVVKRPKTARFLEIKDYKGCTQLVATDDKPDIQMKFQNIPADAFVTVIGTVQLRPSNFHNKVRI